MSRHVGRKTPKDWEDSYYNLEQRYLALQKDVNRREQEQKVAAVAARKGTGSSVPNKPTLDVVQLQHAVAPSTLQRPATAKPATRTTAVSPLRPPSRKHSATSPGAPDKPAAPQPGHHQQSLNASQVTAHADLLAADPRLVWGAEKTVDHFLQVNQLYQTTEQLRRKLEDAETVSKVQQHEIAQLRQAVSTSQSRSEEITMQLHQAVRERDLSLQRLQVANHSVTQVEQALGTQIAEKERIRSVLEGQLQDLRTRLLVSADSNEGMSKDVRVLLADLKEKAGQLAGVQSRLSLAESHLTTQRNTNQSLLVELKNLNDQLTSERKRNLAIMREAQVATLGKERASELESQIDRLLQERTAMEREHLKMLDDFVRVTNDATMCAQESVREELQQARAAAEHWERVSQLLYTDVAQRTSSHIACREACDEAQRERDEAVLAAKALREEVRLSNAKLNIVWPSHRSDTRDMNPEAIIKTYQRLAGRVFGSSSAPLGSRRQQDDDGYVAASPEELVAELEAANAALVAELEAQRLSNDLLTEQLRNLTEAAQGERMQHAATVEKLEEHVEIGRRILERREDLVDFLEKQVRGLRGEDVNPGVSLDAISETDTVLELFVGQMIAADGGALQKNCASAAVEDAFPTLFCTVDFLVHETTSTKMVRGWNSFLDTTIAFRVPMDALLLHYLSTRGVMLQLHKLCAEDNTYRTIAEGTCPVWELLQHAEDARPSLRGCVKLFDVWSDGRTVATVEFVLTSRVPFSQHFKRIAAKVDYNGLLLGDTDAASKQRWRRALHDSVLLDPANAATRSLAESQASVGPSVSVPKVQVAPHADTFEAVSSLRIWLGTARVSFNIDHVPHLSCYFHVAALSQDVYLSNSSGKSLEWRMDTLHSFAVSSMREVFKLARDPLAIFFFDESDVNRTSYWAACSTDLGPCLAAPGQRVARSLNLISYDGNKVGELSLYVEAVPAVDVAATIRDAAGRSLDEELLLQQFGPAVVAHPAPVPPPQNLRPAMAGMQVPQPEAVRSPQEVHKPESSPHAVPVPAVVAS